MPEWQPTARVCQKRESSKILNLITIRDNPKPFWKPFFLLTRPILYLANLAVWATWYNSQSRTYNRTNWPIFYNKEVARISVCFLWLKYLIHLGNKPREWGIFRKSYGWARSVKSWTQRAEICKVKTQYIGLISGDILGHWPKIITTKGHQNIPTYMGRRPGVTA